jgi:hypothetical protein
MTTSDTALLDTNILVYGHQALSPFHEASRAILGKGLFGEISLYSESILMGPYQATAFSPVLSVSVMMATAPHLWRIFSEKLPIVLQHIPPLFHPLTHMNPTALNRNHHGIGCVRIRNSLTNRQFVRPDVIDRSCLPE